MRIEYLALGMCTTNCYLIIEENTGEGILVDPAAQAERLAAWIEKKGVKLQAILLTHGHFDHILAAEALRRRYSVKIYAMEAERELMGDAAQNLSGAWAEPAVLQADVWLQSGQILHLLGKEIQVLHTPGHTPGSCCFYFPEEKVLISGDTLFRESLGRTDFPGSSTREIIASIRRLFTLPEDVTVYPGHGDETTIGYEKKNNPVALYQG